MSPVDSTLRDLVAEQAQVHHLLAGHDLQKASGAIGWTLRDCVIHLWQTDKAAHWAATDSAGFTAHLADAMPDLQSYLDSWLNAAIGLSDRELLEAWSYQFSTLVDALARVPAGTKIPWYGPPMAAASMATARLMEYWAHSVDVGDGLGIPPSDTMRLQNIAHLGVRTRSYSYANRGLPLPEGDVRVTLRRADGDTWEWGAGEDAVEGTALDFCLRVTRRRSMAALDLRTTGPLADEWMRIAQCFAGPPGADPS